MSSKTEICNLALQELGQMPNIVDVDADTTRAAAELRLRYAAARDAALADHPWKFALVRAAWAVSATAPAWGFTKSYPFATDPWCLDVVRLDPDHHGDEPDTWDVVGREVHTDEGSPLYVEYIARVTDEGRFHPMFVEYLATKLAARTCLRITGKAELVPALEQRAKDLARDARWKSAVATGRKRPREGDFLSARAIP